jgi:hypothetical protein
MTPEEEVIAEFPRRLKEVFGIDEYLGNAFMNLACST